MTMSTRLPRAALGLWMVATLFVMTGARAAVAQNYPVRANIELRDSQGNLVDSTHPVCPADGISLVSTGWLSGSNVKGTFYSDPVDIGTHAADSSGLVSFTFRVFNVVTGLHTVRLEGAGANGNPRVAEAQVLCDCADPNNVQHAVAGKTIDNVPGIAAAGTFARTGIDTMAWIAIAFDLMLVGIVLLMASKRRTRSLQA